MSRGKHFDHKKQGQSAVTKTNNAVASKHTEKVDYHIDTVASQDHPAVSIQSQKILINFLIDMIKRGWDTTK